MNRLPVRNVAVSLSNEPLDMERTPEIVFLVAPIILAANTPGTFEQPVRSGNGKAIIILGVEYRRVVVASVFAMAQSTKTQRTNRTHRMKENMRESKTAAAAADDCQV